MTIYLKSRNQIREDNSQLSDPDPLPICDLQGNEISLSTSNSSPAIISDVKQIFVDGPAELGSLAVDDRFSIPLEWIDRIESD